MSGGTRLVLTAGTTRTAAVDGISAAGVDPEALRHTPAADAEIVAYGDVVRAPAVPRSPTGCVTPAVVTRAVRELVGFDLTVVDGGLAEPTAAPTVDVGAEPGGDVQTADPVPDAVSVYRAARELGRSLPAAELLLAETVPGGTTTALGVLRALGESASVSSSLPDNPLERKRKVVARGLSASGLTEGDAAGRPLWALRRMGDPVLAAVAGLAAGGLAADRDVTLAGGTQMLAVAAVLRHAGVDDRLPLLTTTYVAEDDTADLAAGADDLDLAVVASDPGFDTVDDPAMAGYADGEAKEGVGMGGALALAQREDVGAAAVRARVGTVVDELLGEERPAAGAVDGAPRADADGGRP